MTDRAGRTGVRRSQMPRLGAWPAARKRFGLRCRGKKFCRTGKIHLTGALVLVIMSTISNSKPVSKRSKRKGNLSESRGWWDHGRVLSGEWTCEGGANAAFVSSFRRGPYPLSAAAGMIVPETSGRYASTWVVPQDHESCPKWLGQGFFCTHFSRKDEEYAQTK